MAPLSAAQRSERSRKAAATRKRNQTKRSNAAKKGAAVRKLKIGNSTRSIRTRLDSCKAADTIGKRCATGKLQGRVCKAGVTRRAKCEYSRPAFLKRLKKLATGTQSSNPWAGTNRASQKGRPQKAHMVEGWSPTPSPKKATKSTGLFDWMQ